jgi:hypothetical protein
VRFKFLLLYALTFLALLLLITNNVGLSLRDKIILDSTLDFSWFSDAIARLPYGYVLGRDFAFTYGPLFQFIYAFPTIIFQLPAYVSVVLSPILSFVFIFFFVWYIGKNLSENNYERIGYILFVFIFLGLLISGSTDTIRILTPIVYGIALFNILSKKTTFPVICWVAVLPTIFGLYTYNIFITCLLLATLFSAIKFFNVRDKRITKNKYLLILPLIVIVQIFFSFLFTGGLDYILYSQDIISNYKYVMNLTWTSDRSNILLVFPALLIFLSFYYQKKKMFIPKIRSILGVMVLISIAQLFYGLSRSDAGHLLFAVYPSIITFYTIVFFAAYKDRKILILAIIMYMFVPYKPTFYNTLSPKNIMKVFQVIKQKPSFFTVYTLGNNYYYSEREVMEIVNTIKPYKNSVYVYPYDSYFLNIYGDTFNSFSLGIYGYSRSLVEINTVNKFQKDPPKVIVLEVDTKGALNLDDIPNFTRNPLLAKWMMDHYTVKEIHPKYLILSFDPKKMHSGNSCKGYKIVVDLYKKESPLQKVLDLLKPPLFYYGKIRLPYTPGTNDYFVFQNTTTVAGVTKLFENVNTSDCPIYAKDTLTISRLRPFTKHSQQIIFGKGEFSVEPIKN